MDFRFNKFFKKYKKAIIITLSIILILITTGGLVAYSKRDVLLKTAINKAISFAKNKYGLNVNIESYQFTGLSTVTFHLIDIVPEQRDSLARIKDLTIGVKIWPLILGKVKIAELDINDALLSFVKKDSLSNYDFLFKKNSSDSLKTKSNADLSELADKLLNQALDKIPDEMNVQNFLITYKQDTTHLSMLTEMATINDGDVKSTIKLNKDQAVWHVNGTAEPADQQLDLKLFADNKRVEFPYLDNKYRLKISFDTVRTVMRRAEKSGDEFEIEGSWTVKNLLVNQPRLAATDIIVKDGTIDAKILIGSNYLALDSSSVVYLGNAKFNPFLKYTIRPQKIYELKLRSEEQSAQEVFDAFPIGLFESLEGIKVDGKLKYDLEFYLDSKKPDDVILNSSLTPSSDFRILKFGKTNFKKINNIFTYTPFEKGKPVREILVGPSNPDYTPISQISAHIQHALLTSEDPSFYTHKGFVEESLRQSISTNFKAKSFKRGGSTISMQLVKNIYLNRQKNLARKIEEILIVWLIENQKLSSKQRMFEVYLNIIEWGPNVYGIGEAARYYFGKTPLELSVGESIYLAHIVPKPKSSLYAWQPDGSLKPYLSGYFKLIGKLMAKKGYTYNDSTNFGYYSVRLREGLRSQIAPYNSVPDSLMTDEENELFEDPYNSEPKIDSLPKKESILKKLFGNPDSKSDSTNTENKSPKQLRQERREQRRKDNMDNS